MQDLLERTMAFGLDVIHLVNGISDYRVAARAITGQLVRCATSVASNYRAARRAKSAIDFLYKLKLVEEEADESQGWLFMLVRSEICDSAEAKRLLGESGELTAIFSASVITQKRKLRSSPIRRTRRA